MVPRTVLTRSGLISLNAARPVNTVQPRTTVNNAGPMKNVINNAYSTARRPFNKITAANNSNFNKRVNIVNDKNVNAARPNAVVNTARPKAVLSAVKGNKGNVVKASACWVWRPKHKVLDHVSRNNGASMSFKRFDYGNPQQDLKDKGVIDSGCSRHMTGNRSYLTDYEEIDGGFVAFGGNSKGGKITRKGKIRTGKLDFEDVYFVKELKLSSSVSIQMCDHRRICSLFTDTECVVLSPDFKLTNESHVLLKVPRKDNMYSVDLKNVIHQGGLTCLYAIATPDESNLWHRRLGHVNFKTMNKLNQSNGSTDPPFSSSSKDSPDAGFKPSGEEEKKDVEHPRNEYSEVPNVGVEANINNLDTHIPVSPIPTTRIHKDHLVEQIIRNLNSAPPPKIYQGEEVRGSTIKTSELSVCIFLHKKSPRKGKSSFKRSKLDRSYARGASAVHVTTVPDEFYGRAHIFLVLQVKQKEDGIFISQDKYVNEILNKFSFSDVKTARTPMETQKALLKDADGEDVDEHLYRSMIGSLMYLTSSRPDIMFAVCACARFQVNPKSSHLHAMKRIFRYLKGQPKLGLWYPKDSPFDLVAYTDSD
ncbi:ribonuclease H-like domain-containing protein [Tanacetum coccineum]